MSSFTTPLVVSPMPDGRRWKLVLSLTYHIGRKDSGEKIVVRSGFVTDFASVPRPLWGFISPWDMHGKAAVVHDYLYQTHTILVWLFDQYAMFIVTRKEADEIFLEAMEVLGVPKWKRKIMYLAVRLLGWLAWRKE